jgi:hypothetical protein
MAGDAAVQERICTKPRRLGQARLAQPTDPSYS